MDMDRIELKYMDSSGFTSTSFEGVQHVKVLPWLSVVQAVEGSYDIALGSDATLNTGEGGFFVAPAGVRQTIIHHVSPASGQIRCRWLFLDAVVNSTEHFDALYELPVILPVHAQKHMNVLFDVMFSTTDVFERHICCYRILQLLASLSSPKQRSMGHMLQAVLAYITDHLTDEIHIADLAACAHTSPSNLYAVFKQQLGVSPLVYINNARLSLGAEYLRTTTDSVAEIAARVGISDAFYFSRLFRRLYAVSPRQYREEIRNRDI